MNIEKQTLVLNPRRVLYILAAVGIVVLLLSLWGIHMRFFPYNVSNNAQANFIEDFSGEMDFNQQHNIAAYFGTLIMALAAYLSFIVAKFKKAADKVIWSATAWMVFFLSMDNLAEVLQKVNAYFQIGDNPKVPFPISEIVAAFIFIVIVALLWRQLDNQSRWFFVIFTLTYFGGVIGKELTRASGKSLTTALHIFTEQALEYAGEIVLVYTLLHHFGLTFLRVSVSIAGTEESKKRSLH